MDWPDTLQKLQSENESDVETATGLVSRCAIGDDQKLQVARSGVIPHLVRLLKSRNPKTVEYTAHAIDGVAWGCIECKKVLIEQEGLLDGLVNVIKGASVDRSGLPGSATDACIQFSVRSMTQLAHKSKERSQAVVKAGALLPLVELLGAACPKIKEEASWALSKLVENSVETQSVAVECGIIESVSALATSYTDATNLHAACRIVCSIEGDLLAGHELTANIIESLVHMLGILTPSIQFGALAALRHLCVASSEACRTAVNAGAVDALQHTMSPSKEYDDRSTAAKANLRILQVLLHLLRGSAKARSELLAVDSPAGKTRISFLLTCASNEDPGDIAASMACRCLLTCAQGSAKRREAIKSFAAALGDQWPVACKAAEAEGMCVKGFLPEE